MASVSGKQVHVFSFLHSREVHGPTALGHASFIKCALKSSQFCFFTLGTFSPPASTSTRNVVSPMAQDGYLFLTDFHNAFSFHTSSSIDLPEIQSYRLVPMYKNIPNHCVNEVKICRRKITEHQTVSIYDGIFPLCADAILWTECQHSLLVLSDSGSLSQVSLKTGKVLYQKYDENLRKFGISSISWNKQGNELVLTSRSKVLKCTHHHLIDSNSGKKHQQCQSNTSFRCRYQYVIFARAYPVHLYCCWKASSHIFSKNISSAANFEVSCGLLFVCLTREIKIYDMDGILAKHLREQLSPHEIVRENLFLDSDPVPLLCVNTMDFYFDCSLHYPVCLVKKYDKQRGRDITEVHFEYGTFRANVDPDIESNSMLKYERLGDLYGDNASFCSPSIILVFNRRKVCLHRLKGDVDNGFRLERYFEVDFEATDTRSMFEHQFGPWSNEEIVQKCFVLHDFLFVLVILPHAPHSEGSFLILYDLNTGQFLSTIDLDVKLEPGNEDFYDFYLDDDDSAVVLIVREEKDMIKLYGLRGREDYMLQRNTSYNDSKRKQVSIKTRVRSSSRR